MDADTLVRAIRAALDETDRIALAADGHSVFDGTGIVITHDRTAVIPSHASRHIAHNDPAAVLRRASADRRVLERHQPELGIQRAHYCRRCHVPVGDPQWPCDEIRDLCDRLGIDVEGECQ